MKVLEDYFKLKSIDGVEYGIVYNTNLKIEIKYWDKSGSVSIIKEVPGT